MKLLALLTVLFVGFAGCSGLSESIGDAVADKATEAILEEVEASISVKDAFVDGLEQVFVTFGEVSLLNESNVWIPLANSVQTVDLLEYQTAGQAFEIARFTALNVNYSAIRVPILDVEAYDENGPVPLQLHTEVIRIDVGFKLEQDFAALIDFDLGASFDDEGNFQAKVKNVQLSSNDSDGDGLNDFEDLDDDNDGMQDHLDDDVNGDGKADSPNTNSENFDEAGVSSSDYPRAPPKKVGETRWEIETDAAWPGAAAATRKGASGAVMSGSGPFSFESEKQIELRQLRFDADCSGQEAVSFTITTVDASGEQTLVDEGTKVVSCGWHAHQFGQDLPVIAPGTTLRLEFAAESILFIDFLDVKLTTAPVVERTAVLVEGESSSSGLRRNEPVPPASGGMMRRDAADPVNSDDTVSPWNFTWSGSGSYTISAIVDLACVETADVVSVGFSLSDQPWDGTWQWFELSCYQLTTFDLSALGLVTPGDFQLFIRYDFDAGPLALDVLWMNPA